MSNTRLLRQPKTCPCKYVDQQSQSCTSIYPSRFLIVDALNYFPFQTTISAHKPTTIMAEINIDKTQFHERLSHFIGAWKADKRSGDALFNGASSILILLGKAEETSNFQKNNSIHVSVLNVLAASEGQVCDLWTLLMMRDSSGCWVTNFPRRFSFSRLMDLPSLRHRRKVHTLYAEDKREMRSWEKLTMSSKASGTAEGRQDSYRDSSSRKGSGGKCESLRQDCKHCQSCGCKLGTWILRGQC